MLQSFCVSTQKVLIIALENSSFFVRCCVLSRIWINPQSREIPLQSLLALQRKERCLLLLEEKNPQSVLVAWLIKERFRNHFVSLGFQNQKDDTAHSFPSSLNFSLAILNFYLLRCFNSSYQGLNWSTHNSLMCGFTSSAGQPAELLV